MLPDFNFESCQKFGDKNIFLKFIGVNGVRLESALFHAELDRRSDLENVSRQIQKFLENRCQCHQYFMSSFRTIVKRANSMYLQFRYKHFLRKNIGRKAARKMLVKLTTELHRRSNRNSNVQYPLSNR
jgi:hypothetical protein